MKANSMWKMLEENRRKKMQSPGGPDCWLIFSIDLYTLRETRAPAWCAQFANLQRVRAAFNWIRTEGRFVVIFSLSFFFFCFSCPILGINFVSEFSAIRRRFLDARRHLQGKLESNGDDLNKFDSFVVLYVFFWDELISSAALQSSF